MKRRLGAPERAESTQATLNSRPESSLAQLAELTARYGLSVASGDLLCLNSSWYVTHAGLLRIARRERCSGIHVALIPKICDPPASRWAFKATVYKSRTCKGFSGHGDADPSNVSPIVHGAELRVAETRAVNRALRKAYGIGICSVEETGLLASSLEPSAEVKKLSPQSAPANGKNGSGPRV